MSVNYTYIPSQVYPFCTKYPYTHLCVKPIKCLCPNNYIRKCNFDYKFRINIIHYECITQHLKKLIVANDIKFI